MSKKLTIKEFIKKAESVHNFRYDYSKSIYVNNRIKIEIICPKHGSFWQNPNGHMRGSWCKKCSNSYRSKKRRTPLRRFIERANQIHNSKYDYSLVKYVNNPH